MTVSSRTRVPSRTEPRAGSRAARSPGEGVAGPPARATGVELLGEVSGSGYKQAPSLVRRADGQTLQLTPLLYEVLSALDGKRGFAEIATVVGRRISREVGAEDIRCLVEEKLRPLGVLQSPDGSEPAVNKLDPLLGLRLRKVVTDKKATRRITAPFAPLFHPLILVPMVIAFVAVSAWVLFEQGVAGAARQAFYEPGMLLLIFGLTMVSAAFHEIGHASAATYGGATPGAMGVGLYLIWPAFYTDVTDSYRLGRGGRLRVDFGGLYFNTVFTLAVVGAWAVTGSEALLLLVPAQLMLMLHQMLPFVRFDGYHILADLTGVPNLFAHIKPTLVHLLPWHWFRKEPKVLKPWARLVVTLWVLAVVPVLSFAILMMVKVLPRIIATAWDSIGLQWDALQGHISDGSWTDIAVGVLAILTIALPVASMSYLLIRVARRMVMKVWRGTDERPALRGLAVVAGAVALALLAWTWWPEGQYRPIEANETGTLTELFVQGTDGTGDSGIVPGDSAARLPGTYMSDDGEASFRPQLVMLVSEDGSPVTEAGPKSIVPITQEDGDLVPEDGATIPYDPALPIGDEDGEDEWAFPFDPPEELGEDDNQALAINTEDGSTEYDVAIAVLWVTDGHNDEINEAWALANCSQCKTVAVAFQSVFLVGGSNYAVPQNRAVAVNYECFQCQTHAVAVQLVATLSEMPSEAAMAELERVWKELDEWRKTVEDVPLEELHVQLSAFELEILHILKADGVLVEGADPNDNIPPDPDSTTTEDEDVGESENGEPYDPVAEPTAEETVSEEEEPTAEPTEEPSPEPTEEPTPTQEPTTTSEEPTPEPSPTP